jgi:pyruvate dehydrogenase E2 component (dihydrolipoamide acetyltransferase)
VLSAIANIEVEVKVEAEPVLALTSALTSTSSSRLFVSPRARRLAEAEGVPLAAVKATGPEGAIIERDVRAYLDEAQVKAEQILAATSASASITPVARRMAEDAGLDLQAMTGTGARGQITREDVEVALVLRRRGAEEQERREAGEPLAASNQLPASAPAQRAVELPASNLQPPTSNLQPPTSSLPLSSIRALIAERMTASHTRTAPVTLTAEGDATALAELRRKLSADGVAVSYNDLFLAVLAKALREHPQLNAALDGEAIKLLPQIDLGVAVDTDRGLLVPVVRDVGRKGLAQLAAETAALTERARAGRCTPDELTGSTFTLTNLGMFGIDAFTPLINLPECAILGVGRIKTQPVWAGDHVEPRQMVGLSLTFDHRLVDGGPAARFLQRVVQLVEGPHLLMA